MVATAQREAQMRNSGQSSLFGGEKGATQASEPGIILGTNDVSPEEKAAWEREYLGVALSHNPLMALTTANTGGSIVSLDQLSEEMQGQQVNVIGIVNSTTERARRDGQRFFIVTLELLGRRGRSDRLARGVAAHRRHLATRAARCASRAGCACGESSWSFPATTPRSSSPTSPSSLTANETASPAKSNGNGHYANGNGNGNGRPAAAHNGNGHSNGNGHANGNGARYASGNGNGNGHSPSGDSGGHARRSFGQPTGWYG